MKKSGKGFASYWEAQWNKLETTMQGVITAIEEMQK